VWGTRWEEGVVHVHADRVGVGVEVGVEGLSFVREEGGGGREEGWQPLNNNLR
jgi:hypothetical protein